MFHGKILSGTKIAINWPGQHPKTLRHDSNLMHFILTANAASSFCYWISDIEHCVTALAAHSDSITEYISSKHVSDVLQFHFSTQ